jgi:putative Mg2+ transporter-C (MgtC) family protein
MSKEEMILQLWTLLDLLLSVGLGFAIGFERKLRFKEAGIRTHTIVCLGACLMMLVSKYGFGTEADAARVAAQIVSGIGFLGAGIIVYKQHELHGLTTAAGVWATAGVGMACGAQMYLLAVGATFILIASQCIFHIKCRAFQSKKYYAIKIKFLQTGEAGDKVKELFGAEKFKRLSIERKDDRVMYSAMLNTDREYSSARLDEIMRENPFIVEIERCDDNLT